MEQRNRNSVQYIEESMIKQGWTRGADIIQPEYPYYRHLVFSRDNAKLIAHVLDEMAYAYFVYDKYGREIAHAIRFPTVEAGIDTWLRDSEEDESVPLPAPPGAAR